MPAKAVKSERLVLTKSAYAAARGRTPAWVSKMIVRGRLGPPAVLSDGRIDVAAADQMILDRCDPSRGARKPFLGLERPAEAGGSLDLIPIETSAPLLFDKPDPNTADVIEFAAWRTRRERADAETRELQLAKLRGDMVELAQLQRTAADLAGLVRQVLSDRVEDLAGKVRDAANPDDAVLVIQQADQDLCRQLAIAARDLVEGTASA